MFLLMLLAAACLLGLAYLAEGDGGGNSGDPNAGEKAGKSDKTLNADQVQEIVDKAVNARLAREKDKTDAEKVELKKTIKDLEDKAEADRLKKAKADGNLEEVADAQKKAAEKAAAERDEARAEVRAIRIETQVVKAAKDGGAIRPEAVAKLIDDEFVLKEDGAVMFKNGSTLEDGMKKYLDENKWLLEATNTSGSGSPGSSVPSASEKGKSAYDKAMAGAKTEAEIEAVIKKYGGNIASHQVQQ